jgi:hypothetical protein
MGLWVGIVLNEGKVVGGKLKFGLKLIFNVYYYLCFCVLVIVVLGSKMLNVRC